MRKKEDTLIDLQILKVKNSEEYIKITKIIKSKTKKEV